jgi:protein-disulfide isomerase
MSEDASKPDHRIHTGLLACALLGLAFSALLLGEYRSGGLLCTAGGGCDLVRASEYSSIAGVSLPVIGVAYFLALLLIGALPALRSALLPVAAAGALAGAAFIVIQAVAIGAFCPLCLVVDTAALGAGFLAWVGRAGTTPAMTSQKTIALAVLGLAAVSMSSVSQWLAPPQVSVVEQTPEQLPGAVAREQKAEGPVTVVEYIDFECPACRYQYQVFKEVLAQVNYDVRMVYMHSPLAQHTSADGAARAFVCVEGQPEAEDFADYLFTAVDISIAAIETAAEGLGLDTAALRECMSSAPTLARVERDLKLAQQVGVNSLPTFWVGRQKFVGTAEAAAVRQALDRWVRMPAQE